MALALSPLAPAAFDELPAIAGVRIAAAPFNLRYKPPRPDVLLVELAEGTTVAGVYTISTTAAAPVQWCKQAMASGKPARALLVNAGQANAFTGKQGMADAKATAERVAKHIGCDAQSVYVSSTGVIGQPLPMDKLLPAVDALYKQLNDSDWDGAANAIRTTDTFPKTVTRTTSIDGVEVTINGFAKGSGMIAPNMATMLGYLFTDAKIAAPVLQQLLHEANEKSFNSITVDGDASTNDCAIAFATGKANHAEITELHTPQFHDFRHAFTDAMIELAQMIVRDGEGASKFVTVHVNGATSNASARIMALAIANSPLVKTAIAGEDANWGRVVMAVGKTGEPLNQDDISIAFGPYIIARDGAVIEGYDETPVVAYMKGRDIDITVIVGKGMGEAKVWTCDLTHGYIEINGDYRS